MKIWYDISVYSGGIDLKEKRISVNKKTINNFLLFSIIHPYALIIIFCLISMIITKELILTIIFIVLFLHWVIINYNAISWLKKCEIVFYDNKVKIVCFKIMGISKGNKPNLFNPFVYGGDLISSRYHNRYLILEENTIFYEDIIQCDFVQNLKKNINMSISGDLGIITNKKNYCIHSLLYGRFRQFTKEELNDACEEIKKRSNLI